MPAIRTFVRPLALAATAAALTAAPATADSISYVKDGNVYLTTPDGSQTVAVTTTGGYSSASQSDDGRIIALKGTRFHLLNRWGDILADFSPVAAGTAGTITLSGPFDPAISPDGSKVAYGFFVQYKSGDPNCGKPGGCQVGQLYTGTGYSRSDAGVDWSEPGFRPQYSWSEPSWLDDTRTLLSAPSSALVKQTALDVAGDGADASQWFSDGSVGNLYDGEANRQGTAAAFVGNTQGDHLLVYRLPGAPAAGVVPEGCLDAPATGKAWSSPSWSPDGTRLVFAGAQGLYVASLPGLATACPAAGDVKVTAFAPGAASPDWGPAALPSPKPSPTPAPTPAPAPDAGGATPGTTGPTGSGGPTTPTLAGAPTISVKPSSRSRALKRGFTVTATCTGKALRVKASLAGTPIGTGTTACRNGQATLTVRLSAAGRRTLKKVRFATVMVRAIGGASTKVKLR